jgi:hypothetical protein
MNKENSIKLFEDRKIRSVWNEEEEEWYFSVVDIIAVLTESENPRHYWTVLKSRLTTEGNETLTNCERLKMLAPDGKMRMTDVADTKLNAMIESHTDSTKIKQLLWGALSNKIHDREIFMKGIDYSYYYEEE